MVLRAAQGARTNVKELNCLAPKWNIDASDLNNGWYLKMNVERGRRECLELKAQYVAYRRKYLERTGRLVKWKKESRKMQCKSVVVLSVKEK